MTTRPLFQWFKALQPQGFCTPLAFKQSLLSITCVAVLGTMSVVGCLPVEAKVHKLATVGALIGGHPFVLEIANTPEALQKGLMGRTNLNANAGMVFQFPDAPQFRYFWMKGCLIPLDILFINDKRIIHIEHLAQPCLPEVSRLNACPVITTRHNVDTVIEIAGGRARALGLQSGDVLQWLAPSSGLSSTPR